jgi:Tfp pilus assembly protein PilO
MKTPVAFPKLTLQAPYKIALGVTVSLVALVWAVRYLYLPVVSRIGAQRAQLQDLAVKVADAQVLAEALPKHEAALREAESRYRALESRVSEGQSVARILDGLGKWAKDHRLEVVSVQPRANDAEPFLVSAGPGLLLRAVPLSLRLKGRYRQLGEFLGKLPDAPFVGTVRKLTLRQPSRESAQVEADVVLAVYLKERPPTP